MFQFFVFTFIVVGFGISSPDGGGVVVVGFLVAHLVRQFKRPDYLILSVRDVLSEVIDEGVAVCPFPLVAADIRPYLKPPCLHHHGRVERFRSFS